MADERTSLFAEPRPAPSYVFPGRSPRRRQGQMKRFQCCICLSFLSVLFIVLAILVTYAVFEAYDETDPDRSAEVLIATTVSSVPRARDANQSELFSTLVLAQWPIIDEEPSEWQIDDMNEENVKSAINLGIKALGDKDLLEENMEPLALNTPSYRHQKAVSTTAEARKLTKRGFVENQATLMLARNFTKPEGRWNIGNGPKTKLETIPIKVKCNFNALYRNPLGYCNNKENPYTFGVSMLPFRRALNPDYADGISAPRSSAKNDSLPSARTVTLSIHRPSYSSDPHFTVMLAVFGQFLDHDITATALNQGEDGVPIDCCSESGAKHPECFPVAIGSGDPNYEKYNLTCMNFVRSAPAPTGSFGPRQQLNQATAFIDGSAVYGHTEEKISMLRTNFNGTLRMFNTLDNRQLLPISTNPKDGCNAIEKNAKGEYCFDTGDDRANENLHLTSMHLIWARHHNYLATNLKDLNPDWSDEVVYQEARKILSAQLQHITYNEFLPVLLGEEFCNKIGLSSIRSNAEDPYDATINPSIANVFAACAFRFAHTLIPGLMNVTKNVNSTEAVALHKMLFNPYSLWGNGGLDAAIDSAVQTPLAKSDQYFTSELTDKLFEDSVKSTVPSSSRTDTITATVSTATDSTSTNDTATNDTTTTTIIPGTNSATNTSPIESIKSPTKKLPGLDLVSLNIQRGRDHGLPSYSEWRKHCQLPSVDTWDDMKFAVDPNSFGQMKKVYRDAIDVDVYTGALSEPPLKGSIFGPLLACIISDQFLRIKKGDSHWYERRVGPQRFTKEQLDQIYNTTLAAIICRNSDAVTESQKYVMRRTGPGNALFKCHLLDTFDFMPWKNSRTSETPFDSKNFIKIATSNVRVLSVVNQSNSSV